MDTSTSPGERISCQGHPDAACPGHVYIVGQGLLDKEDVMNGALPHPAPAKFSKLGILLKKSHLYSLKDEDLDDLP